MAASALLFIAVVAISAFHFSLGVDLTDCDLSALSLELNRCDDCYTRPTPLRHGHIYMNGATFGAYAVRIVVWSV